jgi:hypothetical protein
MLWSRLVLPVVVVLVAGVMLAIPWLVPSESGPGRTLVFLAAGGVELVLGVALAYLVLHERGEEEGPARRGG